MAEQKYVPEQADQLISFSSRNEDGSWDSGVLGSIVFPENRNPRPSGQPYVKAKMTINLKKLMELVEAGKVKTSKSGYAYIEVNPPLTAEQKAKFAENKPAEQKPKTSTWGNKETATKTSGGWGSSTKKNAPF